MDASLASGDGTIDEVNKRKIDDLMRQNREDKSTYDDTLRAQMVAQGFANVTRNILANLTLYTNSYMESNVKFLEKNPNILDMPRMYDFLKTITMHEK